MKKVRGEGDAVRMVGWRPGGDPRGRGRGRGRGRRVRRLGDLGVEVGDLGGRRVRWGDDVGGGALVEQEEEERLRSVVADEEILQGEEEEVGSEGFVEGEGRDQALLGEEEVGMGEEEVADMAADRDLRDDDDEDVAMGESR